MSLDVAYLALGELEKLLSKHEQKSKSVEDVWNAFTNAAVEEKAAWDRELPKIKTRLEQLRSVVENLEREIEMLAAKRELGLISEENYATLSAELQRKVDEYREKLEAYLQKIAELESRIFYLWARALTKEYLSKFDLVELEKKIEDTREKIDEETYAKMKHEINVMKNTWELLNLLH